MNLRLVRERIYSTHVGERRCALNNRCMLLYLGLLNITSRLRKINERHWASKEYYGGIGAVNPQNGHLNLEISTSMIILPGPQVGDFRRGLFIAQAFAGVVG